MLLQPTESSANLTTFSPKWPAAHSKKVRCIQMKDGKTTFFLSGALRGMNKPISESLPEEIQTVSVSRQRLWELLSPANLGSDPNSWQRSYHRFLHEEGVDAEMQKRAVLFQLWTTQVGILRIKNLKSVCLRPTQANRPTPPRWCQIHLSTPKLHTWIPHRGAPLVNTASARVNSSLPLPPERQATTCDSEFSQFLSRESASVTPCLR